MSNPYLCKQAPAIPCYLAALTRRRLLFVGALAAGPTLSMIGPAPATTEHAANHSHPTRRIDGPGLHHTALYASDVDASISFYERALGFRPGYGWTVAKAASFEVPGRIELIDAGDGNYLELFPAGPNAPAGKLWHIALRFADTASAYRQAIKEGAKPFSFPLADGSSWNGEPTVFIQNGNPPNRVVLAFVQGPDGEVIEMVQNQRL